MRPYFTDNRTTIYLGDCREVAASISGVDAVLTDPPYGLSFMGKGWDHTVPGPEYWRAIAGSCKPGAMLLAFGGTRTWHRLTCAIEDAGLEIRDCLMWLYGSGFPKSLDISKAIDKQKDYKLQAAIRRAAVISVESAGLSLPNNSKWDWTKGEHAPGRKWWTKFVNWLPTLNDKTRHKIERIIVKTVQKTAGWFSSKDIYDITAPATEAAKLWDGYGTALKPAWEPIVLAMKSVDGTFANNARTHGVAGLNVEGCLIPHASEEDQEASQAKNPGRSDTVTSNTYGGDRPQQSVNGAGRWPANVIQDQEAARLLDAQSGNRPGATSNSRKNHTGSFDPGLHEKQEGFADSGGASRFFYTAKASKSDRGQTNDHPTVKPTDLLRYLLKLISTPTGGLVFDPFMGSGSTLVAASMFGGQKAIGCDNDEHSCEIAAKRLAQGTLF